MVLLSPEISWRRFGGPKNIFEVRTCLLLTALAVIENARTGIVVESTGESLPMAYHAVYEPAACMLIACNIGDTDALRRRTRTRIRIRPSRVRPFSADPWALALAQCRAQTTTRLAHAR